jgi:hypothetical protein
MQQNVKMKKSILRTSFLSPGALSGERKYDLSLEDAMAIGGELGESWEKMVAQEVLMWDRRGPRF